MPIHDWTRVDAGTWHAFHYQWIAEIRRALNDGVLPEGYYADPERRTMGVEPDVLTLEEASHELADDDPGDAWRADDASGGGTATQVAAPKLRVSLDVDDPATYANKTRRLVVRHARGDRVVAVLELASPGNKDRASSVEAFARKAFDSVRVGVHFALIDLFPPTLYDRPEGLAGVTARACGFSGLDPAEGLPLWIASIDAGPPHLYAEPLAVGREWVELPLFYKAGRYVNVPLAATYAAAWAATPRRWREVIER